MTIKSKFNTLLLTAGLMAGAGELAGPEPEIVVEVVDLPALTAAVLHMESDGERYDRHGRILTSSKGAKGEMQVMDETNDNPGFGVTPAVDDSADERARVGRDYLMAMVVEYRGNIGQALAAYNAGPGCLNQALNRAARNHSREWLRYMPKETQVYVRNGLKLMNKFRR